jgi:hypothetical protein
MIKSLFLLAGAIFAGVMMPALASASGSGSYRAEQPIERARDPQAELFDLGRRIISRKITCATCGASGALKNKDDAAALLVRIQAGEFVLQPNEQQAALHYLRTRYRLAVAQAQ